jgi:hypothetical protein
MTSGATEAAPTAVTVWGENRHEKLEPDVAQRYPKGMHETIALGILRLAATAVTVRTVTLDDPEHGLTYDLLDRTDVLVWCGHAAHADVSDEVVERCMTGPLRHGPGAQTRCASAQCPLSTPPPFSASVRLSLGAPDRVTGRRSP